MGGTVEEIFVTGEGSAAMERVAEIETVEGCGIKGDRYCEGRGRWAREGVAERETGEGCGSKGDRYCEGTGFWVQYGDVCQVTLIEGEHLDEIEEQGLAIRSGQHRRNIVTRGVRLEGLRGKRFRVGEVVLEYDRSRPPCKHAQDPSAR